MEKDSNVANKEMIKGALMNAFQELSVRGLHFAAKWVAELSIGLGDVQVSPETIKNAQVPDKLDLQDMDKLMLARACYSLREYRKVVQMLDKSKGKEASFMRRYCKYLAGEKQREEGNANVNTELPHLREELEQLHAINALDAFNLYM
jgi:hypothetical protein